MAKLLSSERLKRYEALIDERERNELAEYEASLEIKDTVENRRMAWIDYLNSIPGMSELLDKRNNLVADLFETQRSIAEEVGASTKIFKSDDLGYLLDETGYLTSYQNMGTQYSSRYEHAPQGFIDFYAKQFDEQKQHIEDIHAKYRKAKNQLLLIGETEELAELLRGIGVEI